MVASVLSGIFGSVFLVLFLTSCSHWPFGQTEWRGTDAQARQERCNLYKKQCQQRQETREQACARDFKLVKSDYDQCVKEGACQCRAPIACLGANMGICDRQFASCMNDCGRRDNQGQTIASDSADPADTTDTVIDQVPATAKPGELTTATQSTRSPSASKTEQVPTSPKALDTGTPKPSQAPTTTRPNKGKGPAN
jgi:hypothetical protein